MLPHLKRESTRLIAEMRSKSAKIGMTKEQALETRRALAESRHQFALYRQALQEGRQSTAQTIERSRALAASDHQPRLRSGHEKKGTRLTPRETRVLLLAAWGYSQRQIAARLGISIKTVETHKTNGMGKLKLRGRIGLIAHAVAVGWLTPATAPTAR